MSVAKVIEVSASSPESFGDAIRQGVSRAAGSIEDVRGAWIKEQQVKFDGNEISEYRVNMLVSFVLKE